MAAHRGENSVGHPQHAKEIRLKQETRFLNACFFQCPGYGVARVVNQDVDLTGLIQDRFHGILYARAIRDVHENELGLGDGIDATRVSYRPEHTRSALGHQLRCPSTDPGGNTGDQCDTVRNHKPLILAVSVSEARLQSPAFRQ